VCCFRSLSSRHAPPHSGRLFKIRNASNGHILTYTGTDTVSTSLDNNDDAQMWVVENTGENKWKMRNLRKEGGQSDGRGVYLGSDYSGYLQKGTVRATPYITSYWHLQNWSSSSATCLVYFPLPYEPQYNFMKNTLTLNPLGRVEVSHYSEGWPLAPHLWLFEEIPEPGA